MNWQDEPYVKLYTRDTGDWMFLSFDAQALLMMLMRRVNRQGILPLGKQGRAAVPPMVGHAEEAPRIERALDALLADGCVRLVGSDLVLVNFVEAQKSRASVSAEVRHKKEREVSEVNLPKVTSPDQNYVNSPNRLDQTRLDQSRTTSATAAPLAPPAQVVAPEPVDPNRLLARQTWEAYAGAYRSRYGTEPVRNATVNAQVKQIVKRLGAEAPDVAVFYVGHGSAYYQQKAHGVGPFLADCEALRTQWATGRQVTGTRARQDERTQTNADGWSELLSEEGKRHALGA